MDETAGTDAYFFQRVMLLQFQNNAAQLLCKFTIVQITAGRDTALMDQFAAVYNADLRRHTADVNSDGIHT